MTTHFERTKRGAVALYHIAVRPRGGEVVDLLFGDRAGEEYIEAADTLSVTKSLIEIGRADTITILVDGGRLADVRQRHNLSSELLMTLQAFHDGAALTGVQRLAIVLTKYDVIAQSPRRVQAEADFRGFVANVESLFKTGFAAIRSFAVAAFPATGPLARGTGLPALLDYFVQVPVPRSLQSTSVPPSIRAFGRLQA